MPAMRLTEFGKTRTALPGVPWRELTAHEWAEAKRRHPGIEDRGYFEPVPDEPEPEEKAKGGAGGTSGTSGNGSVKVERVTNTEPGEPRKRSK